MIWGGVAGRGATDGMAGGRGVVDVASGELGSETDVGTGDSAKERLMGAAIKPRRR